MISKGLIFDCVFDPYKWVVAYIKVLEWEFRAWQSIHLIYSQTVITALDVWHFAPEYVTDTVLSHGQIWYVITGQKSVRDIKIWDTLICWQPAIVANAVPWFKKIKPFVYAWVYPLSNDDFDKLRDAFEKLSLNDSAIEYEYENSNAMWFWFRCGFLGMLHMDIVKERLQREYNIDTVFTTPSVIYLVKSKQLSIDSIKSGKNIVELMSTWLWKYIVSHLWSDYHSDDPQLIEILKPRIIVRSWSDMIPNWLVDQILEPIADIEVVWPQEYYGNISELCQDHRWSLKKTDYMSDRIVRSYTIPMWEIIIDFYDKLKSYTKWYATMNYDFVWYQLWDLDKLDILINWELVEAFSLIIHNSKAYHRGLEIINRLKELIPKHLFAIPLQAAIWAKIIARENISAIKKDVLAKCYGWDVSRKRKLLDKQKEWKKKMKEIGRVSVPSDTFLKMMTR